MRVSQRRRNKIRQRVIDRAVVHSGLPSCSYCGRSISRKPWKHPTIKLAVFTIDHIICRARGGSNRQCNLVACCEPCNILKGDRDLDEFILDLGDEARLSVKECREMMIRAAQNPFVILATFQQKKKGQGNGTV